MAALRLLWPPARALCSPCSAACALARRVPRRAASAPSAPPGIRDWRGLARPLKLALLASHPDRVAASGRAADTATNERFVQELFSILDALKAEANASGAPPAAPFAGDEVRRLLVVPAAACGSHAAPVDVELRMPPRFRERLAVLRRRGQHGAAAALALAAAVGATRQVWAALGLPAETVVLAPEVTSAILTGEAPEVAGSAPREPAAADDVSVQSVLAAALRRARERGLAPEPPREEGARVEDADNDAEGALEATAVREHVLRTSPLWQGKTAAMQRPRTFSARSVFRERDRRDRVLRLLNRPGALEPVGDVPAATMAAASQRLRAAMVAYHDALHLYHPLWHSISLRLDPAADACMADAGTLTFLLPATFIEEDFVLFVRQQIGRFARHLDVMSRSSEGTALTRPRERER